VLRAQLFDDVERRESRRGSAPSQIAPGAAVRAQLNVSRMS